MYKLLLSSVLGLLMMVGTQAFGQTIKIDNQTSCSFIYYVTAESGAPACNQQSSNTMTLLPFAQVGYMMSDPIWPSTPPPAGWNWGFMKIGSPTGPYSGGTNACTWPITNINVAVVGNTVCTPFLNLTCMDVTVCTPVKIQWIPYPSGDVKVIITQ